MAQIAPARRCDEPTLRMLLLGDTGVGKTCFMLRFAEDTFQRSFITTVGVDYKHKHVTIDGKRIRLAIWDTAGQERFRAITRSYLRGAQGILLMYDVTDRRSFNHVHRWMQQIEQFGDFDVNIFLIGNKIDLESKQEVSPTEGNALAERYDIPFQEASAKDGRNVEEAVSLLSRNVLRRVEKAAADDPRATSWKLEQDDGRGLSRLCPCWHQ